MCDFAFGGFSIVFLLKPTFPTSSCGAMLFILFACVWLQCQHFFAYAEVIWEAGLTELTSKFSVSLGGDASLLEETTGVARTEFDIDVKNTYSDFLFAPKSGVPLDFSGVRYWTARVARNSITGLPSACSLILFAEPVANGVSYQTLPFEFSSAPVTYSEPLVLAEDVSTSFFRRHVNGSASVGSLLPILPTNPLLVYQFGLRCDGGPGARIEQFTIKSFSTDLETPAPTPFPSPAPTLPTPAPSQPTPMPSQQTKPVVGTSTASMASSMGFTHSGSTVGPQVTQSVAATPPPTVAPSPAGNTVSRSGKSTSSSSPTSPSSLTIAPWLLGVIVGVPALIVLAVLVAFVVLIRRRSAAKGRRRPRSHHRSHSSRSGGGRSMRSMRRSSHGGGGGGGGANPFHVANEYGPLQLASRNSYGKLTLSTDGRTSNSRMSSKPVSSEYQAATIMAPSENLYQAPSMDSSASGMYQAPAQQLSGTTYGNMPEMPMVRDSLYQ